MAGKGPAGMCRAAVTLSLCLSLPNTASLGCGCFWRTLLLPTHTAFRNEQPVRGESGTLGLGEGSGSRVELLLYWFIPFSAD